MDPKLKFKQKCPKHPELKIIFIQTQNIDIENKNKRLFYCSSCVVEDAQFKQENYQSIHNILKHQQNDIIKKWPPLNDSSLIKNLNNLQNNNHSFEQIQQEIISFFDSFKRDILQKIDSCQKQMIRLAQELPEQQMRIFEKYEELSRINELKDILKDTQTTVEQKEQSYKTFYEKISSEKDNITDELNLVLNKLSGQQLIYNTQIPTNLKEGIIQLIERISFFERPQAIKEQRIDIQMSKTDYNNSQKLDIIKNIENNSYDITMNQNYKGWSNCVSQVLEVDKKYILRFKIENLGANSVLVGLMSNAQVNKSDGSIDRLYAQFMLNNNKKLFCNDGYFIGQNGETSLEFNEDKVIEMRISLKDQIYELLDFPNYKQLYKIKEAQQNKLNNGQNLRFFISLSNHNINIKLIDCLIVDNYKS